MWNEMWNRYATYVGNGYAWTLFAFCVAYLLLTEKERKNRIVLVYTSLATMILFFCPLFAGVIWKFADEETYYRVLWLIPMSGVIGYALVKLIASCKKNWQRVIVGICALAIVVLSGDYVFDNPYFSKAYNRFHIPQPVIDVCDAMIVEGREVRAVVPSEMLPYVRQYTANICMPYGRDIMVSTWTVNNPLYDIMQSETVDCNELAALASEQLCHYIVLHSNTKREGDLSYCGYSLVNSVDGYEIYLQDGANITLEYR